MNKRSFLVAIMFFSSILFSGQMSAKMIESTESGDFSQAPEEITQKVQKVVEHLELKQNYRVVSPTQIYLVTNLHRDPFLSIAKKSINSRTGEIVLLFNPDFFYDLTDSQQHFLISWLLLDQNNYFWLMIYILVQILVLMCLFLLLKRTILKNFKAWVSVSAALVFLIIGNNTVLKHIFRYVEQQNDIKFVQMVLKKNKPYCNFQDALITFKHMKNTIKSGYDNGYMDWKPYKKMFDHIISEFEAMNRLVEALMLYSGQCSQMITKDNL